MKPSIPKGTRDFSPQEMVKRNYIFDTIRKVYQSYGYQPIETPAMENLETLMGKYGEEGDRLIFKILNSGDFLDGVNDTDKLSSKELTKSISEKALRYDLTVPFARYVVQHRNDITFPFKRYQIQPVWRADRPQKGRYREFYQCDADVIGSNSLLNEVELIQIIDEVFTKLGLPIIIKVNNRKIIQGLADVIGAPDRMIDLATAMDKWDKIGEEGVIKELNEKGFNEKQVNDLIKFVTLNTYQELKVDESENVVLMQLFEKNELREESELFRIGNEEQKFVFEKTRGVLSKNTRIEPDPYLARGLNYYTGTILEVKVNTPQSTFTGSLCGGGRYDDLTGIFGLPNVSGVGISFGADRIYDVMEELKLFPAQLATSTKVMFINFGESEAGHCFPLLKELRNAGISSELYPDAAKIKKQMDYANNKQIAYVAFLGAEEVKSGMVKLKNMTSGEEREIPFNELVDNLAKN